MSLAVACGGFASYLSVPDVATSCQKCLENNDACNDALACAASAECDAFWRCYLGSSTPDGKGACFEAHDAGAGLFQSLYRDLSGTCAGPCGYGAYWACVGDPAAWPNAMSTTVSVTWWADDYYSNNAPVQGAIVSACTSCPCAPATAPVLAQNPTDMSGFVTLDVPQTLSTTRKALPLCLQTQAQGYLGDFLYLGFPLSEPSFSIADALLPKLALGIQLLSVQGQMATQTALGVPFDPTRGLIGINVTDCLGNLASGVFVTLDSNDPSVFPIAAVDAGVGGGAIAQTINGGQNNGRAFFLNVEAGSYTRPTHLRPCCPMPGHRSTRSRSTLPPTRSRKSA